MGPGRARTGLPGSKSLLEQMLRMIKEKAFIWYFGLWPQLVFQASALLLSSIPADDIICSLDPG